jgi:hypothetical protein
MFKKSRKKLDIFSVISGDFSDIINYENGQFCGEIFISFIVSKSGWDFLCKIICQFLVDYLEIFV